jgi:hypothetical protein
LEDKSLNAWGPHISDSPQNCKEIVERFVSNFILVANYTKEKKHKIKSEAPDKKWLVGVAIHCIQSILKSIMGL